MTNEENKAVKQARLFAEVLERKDYEAARAMLAPECIYFQLARDLHGPEAIVAEYERASRWGIDQFESIERDSSVTPTEDGRAWLTFFYHVRHKGKSLKIRSEQIIELDEAGRIGQIEHIELASQANTLFQFYIDVGLINKNKEDS
ncbi:MAG: nuclear transport factor 2 family protein [Sedimentisphaerales bacterium]|nr:nuclear transport factor 2 family protein [Sedimentisphaerales bacterium]